MDRMAFESELKREGYEVRENAMEAGRTTPEHTHPFDARLLVLSGEITVTFDGRERTCRAGDSFALTANTVHTEKVGPEGVTYVSGGRTPGTAA